MNPTEYLTYSERITRIGQLLSKGITLLLMEEDEEKRRAASVHKGNASPDRRDRENRVEQSRFGEISDDTERQILEYLNRVGKASPRDIQRALEIPKPTAFRKLARLAQIQLVVRSGKTTAIRYRLTLPVN